MAKASASPAPSTSEAASAKTKVKVEPVASPALISILEKYDTAVGKAETYYIEMVEYIQEKQLDRGTVVASLMKARGITFETAQSQYSRMKNILNNEEVLAELKEGKITLQVARQRTTKKQENPTSAKSENKEAKFNSTLKAFATAAKESGFSIKEILVTVEAELKSAGIK